METIAERTKYLRNKKKWSQQRLAKECGGISWQAIQQLENGLTAQPRFLERLADALGTTPEWLLFGRGDVYMQQSAGRGMADMNYQAKQMTTPPEIEEVTDSGLIHHGTALPKQWVEEMYGIEPIPLYGSAAGDDGKAVTINDGEIQGWIPPHPKQMDALGLKMQGIIALYVHGDSMAPRYKSGEIVFVRPDIPSRGDDIVIEFSGDLPDYPDGHAVIKTYLNQTATEILCHQYNPDATLPYPKKAIRRVYTVVGRG